MLEQPIRATKKQMKQDRLEVRLDADSKTVPGRLPEPAAGRDRADATTVRRFLDLSTAHLQPADRSFLDHSADPDARDGVVVMRGAYGWFVYAHDDRCCDGISDVLWAIFRTARAHGCDYVLFDADADTMGSLPVFEDA